MHKTSPKYCLSITRRSRADGDDPKATEDFQVAILAHEFGRFSGIRKFRFRDLRKARPRLVLTLLLAALSSGAIAFISKKKRRE
jgi:hypothetical protein